MRRIVPPSPPWRWDALVRGLCDESATNKYCLGYLIKTSRTKTLRLIYRQDISLLSLWEQETIKRWRNCELTHETHIIKGKGGIARPNRPWYLHFLAKSSISFVAPLPFIPLLIQLMQLVQLSLLDFMPVRWMTWKALSTISTEEKGKEKRKKKQKRMSVWRRCRVHHSADNLMSLTFSESWWLPNWNMLNRCKSHFGREK